MVAEKSIGKLDFTKYVDRPRLVSLSLVGEIVQNFSTCGGIIVF